MTPAPAPPATYRPQPDPGAYIPRVETGSLYTGFMVSDGFTRHRQVLIFDEASAFNPDHWNTIVRRIESGE